MIVWLNCLRIMMKSFLSVFVVCLLLLVKIWILKKLSFEWISILIRWKKLLKKRRCYFVFVLCCRMCWICEGVIGCYVEGIRVLRLLIRFIRRLRWKNIESILKCSSLWLRVVISVGVVF